MFDSVVDFVFPEEVYDFDFRLYIVYTVTIAKIDREKLILVIIERFRIIVIYIEFYVVVEVSF